MTKQECKKQIRELKLQRKTYKEKVRVRDGSWWQRCQLSICSPFVNRANKIRSNIENPAAPKKQDNNKAEQVLVAFESLVDKMTASVEKN